MPGTHLHFYHQDNYLNICGSVYRRNINGWVDCCLLLVLVTIMIMIVIGFGLGTAKILIMGPYFLLIYTNLIILINYEIHKI